jgi:hypothetical protein
MENAKLANDIMKKNTYNLMGYKYIENLTKLKENTYIIYYNLKTQKLSKRVSIKKIYYFSEITKTQPMKLEVSNANNNLSEEKKHYWNIICKQYIIFRQFEQTPLEVKNRRRVVEKYITEQIDLHNKFINE